MKSFLVLCVIWFSAQAWGYGLKDFLAAVQDPKIKTLSDALAVLPEDMRTHYVLMAKSRSLQGASAENPRVLLYGKTATLFVSFNGHPDQMGYDSIEAMGFDVPTRTYEMRHIQFPLPGDPDPSVYVSGPDPTMCTVCHKSPARNVWEPHPHWPGAVGQQSQLNASEVQYLKTFVTRSRRHPRYRHLNAAKNYRMHTAPGALSPAAHLNRFMLSHNLIRIPNWITRLLPNYQGSRYAIAAALSDCPDIANYAPKPFDTGVWNQIVMDMRRRFNRIPAAQKQGMRPTSLSVSTKLRYLFQTAGADFSVLPSSHTERYLISVTGTAFPHLLKGLIHIDPTLKQMLDVPYKEMATVLFPDLYPPTQGTKQTYAAYCAKVTRLAQSGNP